MEVAQDRYLEAGIEAKTRKKCCSLAHVLAVIQYLSYKAQTHLADPSEIS